MKRPLTIGLACLLSASGLPAIAQEAPVIARYVPAGPDPRHVFVTDSAHILSGATIRALQDSAQALQTETGADVAWVTLPTLGGRAIEDATVYLGRTWKVGSAGQPGDPLRNRGLVILYVPDKSKTAGSNFRVEVGKGLQGTIIDSRSRKISQAMRDDLRAKRFDAAYLAGWNVTAAMVRADFAAHASERGAPAVPAAPVFASSRGPQRFAIPPLVMVGVGLLVLLGFVWFVVSLVRRRAAGVGMPSSELLVLAALLDNSDDERRRRDDSGGFWSGSDSSSDSGSSDSGGDFGGGGGFDGGGSSDSI